MIDPKGLRSFRPDHRTIGSGPDETEGRMLYRARADAEARRQIASTRKVTTLRALSSQEASK